MGTWGSQHCRAREERESINVSWKENEACSNRVLLIEGKRAAQSTKVAGAGARGRQMRMKRGRLGSGGWGEGTTLYWWGWMTLRRGLLSSLGGWCWSSLSSFHCCLCVSRQG